VQPGPEFERTLAAAEGYFLLEMWEDAWAELEELAPEFRHLSEVIILRVMIYNNLERWEEAAIVGKGALRHYPDFGALYMATALALRHHSGPAKAKEVLVAGGAVPRKRGGLPFPARLLRLRVGASGRGERGLAARFRAGFGFQAAGARRTRSGAALGIAVKTGILRKIVCGGQTGPTGRLWIVRSAKACPMDGARRGGKPRMGRFRRNTSSRRRLPQITRHERSATCWIQTGQ